jgi:hypothetical protein
MRGKQKKKKSAKKNWEIIDAANLNPVRYLLAQEASLRQYIGAVQVYPSLILQQIS